MLQVEVKNARLQVGKAGGDMGRLISGRAFLQAGEEALERKDGDERGS